jgi:hypothetical protein
LLDDDVDTVAFDATAAEPVAPNGIVVTLFAFSIVVGWRPEFGAGTERRTAVEWGFGR